MLFALKHGGQWPRRGVVLRDGLSARNHEYRFVRFPFRRFAVTVFARPPRSQHIVHRFGRLQPGNRGRGDMGNMDIAERVLVLKSRVRRFPVSAQTPFPWLRLGAMGMADHGRGALRKRRRILHQGGRWSLGLLHQVEVHIVPYPPIVRGHFVTSTSVRGSELNRLGRNWLISSFVVLSSRRVRLFAVRATAGASRWTLFVIRGRGGTA